MSDLDPSVLELHTERQPEISDVPMRYARRLSDKILIAFHHACDDNEREIAKRLLDILETLINRPPAPTVPNRRRQERERLVAAHQRLWCLWHDADARADGNQAD